MDAASQRGIDDIREIRDRVVLQPVEGRYKVYILDEAHQLTDAAWNALLKLIEEPPPHLVFVFCTTDLSKVLPTVRSRCQTFVFQRPRLQDLVKVLRQIADAEGIDAPDQALALVARSARGAYRDAVSTLDQLASATGNQITVQSVLELLGTVEEEALFRLCDLVIDRDTAGALTYLEELAERGHDLGRLVLDLLEHLRQLMLAQHLGDVPEAAASSEETRERLQAQANQLEEATVLRLVDLLAVAVDDMRQGGDPRLPLELALVKVTRPASDLSRESIAFRLERLEQGHVADQRRSAPVPSKAEEPRRGGGAGRAGARAGARAVPVGAPGLELSQLQEAWARTGPARRRGARRDPDGVAATRSASGRPQRRHAHARVPAERAVPSRPRPRPEEREASSPTRSTTSPAAGSSSSSSSARRARRRRPTEEPAGEEEFVARFQQEFDARERES